MVNLEYEGFINMPKSHAALRACMAELPEAHWTRPACIAGTRKPPSVGLNLPDPPIRSRLVSRGADILDPLGVMTVAILKQALISLAVNLCLWPCCALNC